MYCNFEDGRGAIHWNLAVFKPEKLPYYYVLLYILVISLFANHYKHGPGVKLHNIYLNQTTKNFIHVCSKLTVFHHY